MNDPIADSINNPLVLIVRKSRAGAWPQVLNILNTLNIQPNENNEWYFVVEKNPESFAKAISIIELMGRTKSLLIYANGTLVPYHKPMLIRIGQCYIKSFKVENYKNYCHCIHEYSHHNYMGRVSISVDFDNSGELIDDEEGEIVERAIIPCRSLYGYIKYELGDRYESPEKILAMAVGRGFDLCPRFNHKEHLELLPQRITSDGKVDTDWL